MRVFVTGAAGFIGRALVEELQQHGHTVVGLARNDANAKILTDLGAQVHRGDLEDLASLRAAAKSSDGVIHLAFIHDFSQPDKVSGVDNAAVEAMASELTGMGKPMVVASGLLGMAPGVLATEDHERSRAGPMPGRHKSINILFALSKEKNVRGSVIRLSPTVHDKEDKGLIPMMVGAARQAGELVWVGDGAARWPAVHRKDAAVLFRLALEKGTAGATYHGCAEQGVPMKDIMTAVGKATGLPVEGKSMEEATKMLGPLAGIAAMDVVASSEKTQKELGWTPKEVGLLTDLEKNYTW